jgi:Domain of unknown function (DUF305)
MEAQFVVNLSLISRLAPRGDRGRRRCRGRVSDCVFRKPANARRLHLSDLRKVVSLRVCDRGPYLAENVSAMTKMMIDMGIRPSGNVDTDFVAMMVPHHQGAIEMARAELRYGRNEPLRRMAQEIIVTQAQEITAMRLSLGQPLPPSVPSPDQIPPAPRQQLEAEILVLRHQLNVLQQRVPPRPRLRWLDRALFILLYRRCPRILNAITIVRPETVLRWHRRGFVAYWRTSV